VALKHLECCEILGVVGIGARKGVHADLARVHGKARSFAVEKAEAERREESIQADATGFPEQQNGGDLATAASARRRYLIEIYKCSRAWRQKSECGDFPAEITDTTRRVGNAELVSEVCSVRVGGNYRQKETENCPQKQFLQHSVYPPRPGTVIEGRVSEDTARRVANRAACFRYSNGRNHPAATKLGDSKAPWAQRLYRQVEIVGRQAAVKIRQRLAAEK
jgi:hypothetical protein